MEVFEIIIAHVSIWLPSLAAALGVVLMVLKGISEVRKFIASLKSEEITEELRKNNEALSRVIAENEELKKAQRILIDKLTKIKDYVDNKPEE